MATQCAVRFNQDASFACMCTSRGVSIYSLEGHRRVLSLDIGTVSLAEMLFCTSLLALVGAGAASSQSPRWLRLWDTASNSLVKELGFTTSVLAVALNKVRLVVLLRRQACVYELPSMRLLQTIDTPGGEASLSDRGTAREVLALTPCSSPCLLALPCGPTPSGVFRVYDLLGGLGTSLPLPSSLPRPHGPAPPSSWHSPELSGDLPAGQDGNGGSTWAPGSPCPPMCSVLCEVEAHRSPLTFLAWSPDGCLLASASKTGTVVRVTRLPGASRAFSLRRGSLPATITCLAFSALGMEPPLLAVASTRGTCHIFRLEEPGAARSQQPAVAFNSAASMGAAAAAGVSAAVAVVAQELLTTVSRVPAVHAMVEPSRSLASIKVPCAGLIAQCAIFCKRNGAGSSAGSAADLSPSLDPASVSLTVATQQGRLYEYELNELRSPAGPRCCQTGEWDMLAA
ncbi:WD40-repeat-containing domain protein [Haematococcus lacustris]